ncbi:MAG: UdgX family uracil-DNA binding protein [Solirubrobacteraceae bacterium]
MSDATPFLPPRGSLKSLRDAAAVCRACELWHPATQTVFGEGLKRSRVMMVGEMPGDREDRLGHVFVGPGGHELDRALEAVGIERSAVYLTNAVKHFRFEERGRRRIHQRPTHGQVEACLPWLREELRVVAPEVLVFLGAVAAQALLGADFRLTRARGRPLDSDLAELVIATVHPAAILRAQGETGRRAARAAFRRDLAVAARAL